MRVYVRMAHQRSARTGSRPSSMRSRVSVTGSAAAGPSLRARRHNLNEPRKQSFPCFLRPPEALCQQAQNVPHGTATVDTVLAMVSRTASWRVSAFDQLDEPTGESTSELLHCHDLDATRFTVSRLPRAPRGPQVWCAPQLCGAPSLRSPQPRIRQIRTSCTPSRQSLLHARVLTAVDASQRRQFPPH